MAQCLSCKCLTMAEGVHRGEYCYTCSAGQIKTKEGWPWWFALSGFRRPNKTVAKAQSQCQVFKEPEPLCEVCGVEPEWRTGFSDDPIIVAGPGRTRFLCARHRDEWFQFTRSNQDFMHTKTGRLDHGRWQEVFDQFIAQAKKGEGAQ